MRTQEIKRKRISHPIYLRKTNFITFDLFVICIQGNTSFLSLIGCIYDYLLLCGELKAFQMPLPSIKTRYYSSYRRTRKIAFIKLSFRFTKKCERRRTKICLKDSMLPHLTKLEFVARTKFWVVRNLHFSLSHTKYNKITEQSVTYNEHDKVNTSC